MITLVRPARLQSLCRYLSYSAVARARGGGRFPRQPADSDNAPAGSITAHDYSPVEVPVVDRLRGLSQKSFDMGTFTEAVREKPRNSAPAAPSAESWRRKEAPDVDAFGLEVEAEPPSREEKKPPRRQREVEEEPVKKAEAKKVERKPIGNAMYPYLEDKDPMFKRVLTDIKNRSLRAKSRKILLEGHRLINDALLNGIRVKTVFFSHPELVENLSREGLRLMKTELYQISPKQMKLYSDMTTPPGVMAVSDMPDVAVMDLTKQMPLTVVLDNIRDPGNMGAIIRVLAAASSSQIICMKGCVDPWDSKVLRAAMGAHFHIPIQHNTEWELINNHLTKSATVFLADNLEEKTPGAHFDTSKKRGVRLFPKNEKHKHKLETIPYHHVDFSDGNVVLIIGGESKGVSESAYKETAERKGKKLFVPLANYVESLNAASVVAVLAFEMRRQRLLLDDDVAQVSKQRHQEEEEEEGSEGGEETVLGKLP